MKKIRRFLFLFFFLAVLSVSAQELQPFFTVGKFNKTIPQLSKTVDSLLTESGYKVLGSYHPAQQDTLFVICFTNSDIEQLGLQFPDRGALGAILKAGLIRTQGKTTLSILNPEYQFIAYWGQQLNGQEEALKKQSEKVVSLFGLLGQPTPFGGKVARDRLVHYHYKMMMPYFDDPDELAEYDSFEEGLQTISANLSAGKGHTRKVYQLVFPEKKVAVFGVAMFDPETGEADYLPVIGVSHIAALPYEIILQDNKATSLAGKYRIALYWPELGMGTFMKIIKTPGNIEDTLEKLTSK